MCVGVEGIPMESPADYEKKVQYITTNKQFGLGMKKLGYTCVRSVRFLSLSLMPMRMFVRVCLCSCVLVREIKRISATHACVVYIFFLMPVCLCTWVCLCVLWCCEETQLFMCATYVLTAYVCLCFVCVHVLMRMHTGSYCGLHGPGAGRGAPARHRCGLCARAHAHTIP